jgi:hypothetical protein
MYKRGLELLIEYIMAMVLLPLGSAIIYTTGAVNYHVPSPRKNHKIQFVSPA